MRKRFLSALLTVLLCLPLLPAGALASGLSYGPDAKGYGFTVDKSAVDLGKISYTAGAETVNEAAFTLTITNTGSVTIVRKKTETLYLMAGAGFSIIEGEYEIAPGQSREVTYGYRIRENAKPGKASDMLFFDFHGGDPVIVTVTYELERTDGSAGSSWSREPINGAIDAGLVDENDVANSLSTSAALSAPITRREFCHLACRTYEKLRGPVAEEQYGAMTFTDCDSQEVRKMAALDVVRGIGGGLFDPDGLLTREQAAAMLSRLALALGKPFADVRPTFADVGDVSAWALAAVGQMQDSGVMNGTGANNFTPQGTYSWEQSVVTVYRLYSLMK